MDQTSLLEREPPEIQVAASEPAQQIWPFLRTYCLVWMTTLCAAYAAFQIFRSGSRVPAPGHVFIGVLFTCAMVGSWPLLLGAAHVAFLRSAECAPAALRQRLAVASMAVGGVLGLLPLAAMVILTGSLTFGSWAWTAFGFELAGLTSGYAIGWHWVRSRNRAITPLQCSPGTGGVIGAAGAWTLVYWGLMLYQAFNQQQGNLSGLAEMFYAFPASIVGGLIGTLLASLYSPAGQERVPGRKPRQDIRRVISPALFLWLGLTLLLSTWFIAISARTVPPPRSNDPKQERAAAAFRKLGGRIQVDPSRPDKPVVALTLTQDPITDADLAAVTSFPQLRTLDLTMTRISDAGLVHLRGLTELQKLQLAAVRVRGPGLEHLRGLKKLRSLSLTASWVNDAGLVHLKGMPELQELHLANTATTNAGMAHTRGLKKLRIISLGGSQVTDPGFANLREFTELRELYLPGAKITDRAMPHLAGLSHLHTLTLDRTQVTDAALPHFYGLTRLRKLRLVGAPVTDAAVRALQRKLPRAEITWGTERRVIQGRASTVPTRAPDLAPTRPAKMPARARAGPWSIKQARLSTLGLSLSCL